MGITLPTFTDYSKKCGQLPQNIIEMLANCMVNYEGHTYLNLIIAQGYCSDMSDFWTCDNNGIEPDRALVENLFALDECGRLGLKVVLNYEEEQ